MQTLSVHKNTHYTVARTAHFAIDSIRRRTHFFSLGNPTAKAAYAHPGVCTRSHQISSQTHVTSQTRTHLISSQTRNTNSAYFMVFTTHVVLFVAASILIPMPVASVKYVRTGHGLFGRPLSSGGTVMAAPRIVSTDNRTK